MENSGPANVQLGQSHEIIHQEEITRDDFTRARAGIGAPGDPERHAAEIETGSVRQGNDTKTYTKTMMETTHVSKSTYESETSHRKSNP